MDRLEFYLRLYESEHERAEKLVSQIALVFGAATLNFGAVGAYFSQWAASSPGKPAVALISLSVLGAVGSVGAMVFLADAVRFRSYQNLARPSRWRAAEAEIQVHASSSEEAWSWMQYDVITRAVEATDHNVRVNDSRAASRDRALAILFIGAAFTLVGLLPYAFCIQP
jgi:hypothetical protein